MAVLRVVQGLNPGQLIPIEGDSAVLGRHPDCDVVLESGAVSRQHARVSRVDGKYYVEDLGSRNGTFVNGQPVVARRPLRDHDELGICDLTFVFHLRSPEPDSSLFEPQAKTTDTTAVIFDDRPGTGSRIMSKVNIATGSAGLQLEVNPQAKLKAMMEIAQNLGQAIGLDAVLTNLLKSLFTIFVQADRGFILLQDRSTQRLVPKAVKYRREDTEVTARISRTIVHSVMQAKEAILSADAATDSRFDMAESIVDFQIRSMMCAPLVDSEGNALGVIQIDTLDQRHRFSREDLEVLASVACLAAVSVENAQLHETALKEKALERELAVAHEVQRGLLPARSPELDGYGFFAFYEPANQLGGDYYDYVLLPGGRLAVVVADVAGKGITASLLMARFSAETRYCLVMEPTPGEAIGKLNRLFCSLGWDDRFVTLVLAVLDPARHEVTVVNAGHWPPLLRRDSVVVEPVAESATGLPLGVDEATTYDQATLPLAPGDSLTLFTDGITEAMNNAGRLYGHQRMVSRLASATGPVGDIGRALLDDVKRFVGSRAQSDDMCLTCVGRDHA